MGLRTARALVVARLLPALLVLSACGRSRTEEIDRGSPVATREAPKAPPAPISAATEQWNASQIDWQPFDAGLRRAQADKKPVCLVIYTTWCPHCRNFSRVFDDPRIATRARDFVMIRVDADAEPAVAAKYARDGGYIPRTFFLAPDGALEASIHAPRDRYQYFYDEQNPAALLEGMETALRKLGE